MGFQAGNGCNELKTGSQFTDLGGEFEGKNDLPGLPSALSLSQSQSFFLSAFRKLVIYRAG
ncbi:MAG: hypothetical protein AMXMBFR48_26360 [Ignavibacteriales bacterium]|jgi:hypothetical protein